MGVTLQVTSGPVLERAGDLAAILTNLQPHGVLFVDEIHRLAPDRGGDPLPGPGGLHPRPGGRAGAGRAHHAAPVAAASRWSARPPAPGCCPRRCATASASCTGSTSTSRDALTAHRAKRPPVCWPSGLEDDAASEIARRSRGTPRIANRLLRRVRDFAHAREEAVVSLDTARFGLERLEVDAFGLDELDRRLLVDRDRAVRAADRWG